MKKLLFTSLFLFATIIIYAQTPSLGIEGKWVFEDVFISYEHDPETPLNPDSVGVEIYNDLEIDENMIIFKSDDIVLNMGRKSRGNFIYLSFLNESIYAESIISDEKLFLLWSKDVINETGDIGYMTVSLVYKRK